MKMLIDTKLKNPYDSFALAIKSIWPTLFRGVGKILLLGIAAFLSTNLAIANPPRASCEDDGVGGCVNTLLDQQDEMITGLEDIVDVMVDARLFSLVREETDSEMQQTYSDRIANLRGEHARGRAVNELTTDEEYDAMLTQGDNETGKNCKNSDMAFYNALKAEQPNTADPLPPGLDSTGANFGNGKCDIFDAVDEDGNDVRVNERKENMCSQLCINKKDSAGNSRAGQSKGRFLGRMDGAIASSRKVVEMLSLQGATISQLGVHLRQLHLASDGALDTQNTDICVVPENDKSESEHLEAELALQIVITELDAGIAINNILIETIEAMKDSADLLCGQDGAGFNVNSTCIPIAVLTHIAKGLNGILKDIATLTTDAKELVKISAAINASTKTDNTLKCSKSIRDQFVGPEGKIIKLQSDVAELNANMGTLQDSGDASNDALAELKEQMTQLQQIIEANQELLLTPFGARNNLNKN